MSGGLPTTIDPVQLAERGARLNGTLAVDGMARLSQSGVGPLGTVEVDLRFERSETARLYRAEGQVRAILQVPCQRCLERMALSLDIQPHWLFVRAGAQHGSTPSHESDVIAVDRPLSLRELVEDELLLALPMVPMHDLADCPARQFVTRSAQPDDAASDADKE